MKCNRYTTCHRLPVAAQENDITGSRRGIIGQLQKLHRPELLLFVLAHASHAKVAPISLVYHLAIGDLSVRGKAVPIFFSHKSVP